MGRVLVIDATPAGRWRSKEAAENGFKQVVWKGDDIANAAIDPNPEHHWQVAHNGRWDAVPNGDIMTRKDLMTLKIPDGIEKGAERTKEIAEKVVHDLRTAAYASGAAGGSCDITWREEER